MVAKLSAKIKLSKTWWLGGEGGIRLGAIYAMEPRRRVVRRNARELSNELTLAGPSTKGQQPSPVHFKGIAFSACFVAATLLGPKHVSRSFARRNQTAPKGSLSCERNHTITII